MKVCHWSAYVGSGQNNVVELLANAEKALGLDSHVVDIYGTYDADQWSDSDVHVAHTHFPYKRMQRISQKPFKVVWVGHGVPEHLFETSVEESRMGYGHGDPWMLFQFWLQHADARVTFWPRHKALMETMVDKGVPIHLVPLGVDKAFWEAGGSQGKYQGNPSVWSGESCYPMKWPIDLFLLWPWIIKELDEAVLHVNFLDISYHRWFFPLVNRNGVSYSSHISPVSMARSQLCNTFKSVDFMIGLVKKGDFNNLSLEANATGCKTISYPGNPYSAYWVTEGDQRTTAKELIAIFKGEVEPREREPVPDISTTAEKMMEVYGSIL